MLLLLLCGSRILLRSRARNDRAADETTDQRANSNAAVGLTSGRKLRGKGFQTVPPDDRLLVKTPGGAGIGDPAARPPSSVRDDIDSGLVSSENAAAVYGFTT